MLIGQEGKKLVFDDRAAHCAACDVAMQLRGLVVGGNVRVLIHEEWSGVDPVGAAVDVGRAVIFVGARGGAQVDMRARGRTLLRIVHRCVDPDFGNGFRRGRGNGVADREINRGRRLDDAAAAAGAGLHAGRVDDARRSHLAGALAIEQVAGVNAIQQK